MQLIIGLGNPGKEYEKTRHNIGREIVYSLGDTWKIQKKLFAETAEPKDIETPYTITIKNIIRLAVPTTYMNDSGNAAHALLNFWKETPDHLLVVHDDIDLPFGIIRFSYDANSGGQKGVQSIIDILGTKKFWRLRIGISGKTRAVTDAATYVLQKFSSTESTAMKIRKDHIREAILFFLREGGARAMNEYNPKK